MFSSDELAAALRDIAAGVERLAHAVAPPAPPTPTAAGDSSQQRHGEPYMNKKQAAEYLGVSVRTVTNWQRSGLPHHRVGGVVLFARPRLDQWIEGRRA